MIWALRCKIKETEQVVATLHSEMEARKRRIHGTEYNYRQVVTTLHYQIRERDTKLEHRSFHKQEKTISLMDSDRGKVRDLHNVEMALCGQVKQLKQTIAQMESDREERVRDCKNVEKALRAQTKLSDREK